MDFLDPRKRRAYHIRLMVGYFLVAVVIGLATVIIVYGANGYGINTKTGQIVQNGLLFVDSQPGGAKIYLNGHTVNKTTSARLVLPAGNYTLDLKKDGYRDWSRSFTLSEQSIGRYVYPFLFPVKPVVTSLKSYSSQPKLITESPDRKWLLVENNEASDSTVVFDQYDTSTLDQDTPDETSVSIPASVLTNYGPNSQLTEVEWSTDNNNVILKHSFGGGSEFIVFNRAHPDQSFNVNDLFNFSPTEVSLFNKKADQLYLYNQADQTLRLADVGLKKLPTPLLSKVLAYKPYGKNLISFVTDNGEPAGQVAAKIWDRGQVMKVDEFPSGHTYLIDAAQFQDHFYFVSGSDTSERINIYKDPEDNIRDPAVGKAIPTIALQDPGASWLKFSDNARFVAAEAGQNFAVYDFETQNYYQYTLSDQLADGAGWMDGHRLMGDSGGNVVVVDFDNTNKQLVTPTSLPLGGYFSGNYNHLLTVASNGGTFGLQDVDMRAGADLPKNKQTAVSQ